MRQIVLCRVEQVRGRGAGYALFRVNFVCANGETLPDLSMLPIVHDQQRSQRVLLLQEEASIQLLPEASAAGAGAGDGGWSLDCSP